MTVIKTRLLKIALDGSDPLVDRLSDLFRGLSADFYSEHSPMLERLARLVEDELVEKDSEALESFGAIQEIDAADTVREDVPRWDTVVDVLISLSHALDGDEGWSALAKAIEDGAPWVSGRLLAQRLAVLVQGDGSLPERLAAFVASLREYVNEFDHDVVDHTIELLEGLCELSPRDTGELDSCDPPDCDDEDELCFAPPRAPGELRDGPLTAVERARLLADHDRADDVELPPGWSVMWGTCGSVFQLRDVDGMLLAQLYPLTPDGLGWRGEIRPKSSSKWAKITGMTKLNPQEAFAAVTRMIAEVEQ